MNIIDSSSTASSYNRNGVNWLNIFNVNLDIVTLCLRVDFAQFCVFWNNKINPNWLSYFRVVASAARFNFHLIKIVNGNFLSADIAVNVCVCNPCTMYGYITVRTLCTSQFHSQHLMFAPNGYSISLSFSFSLCALRDVSHTWSRRSRRNMYYSN